MYIPKPFLQNDLRRTTRLIDLYSFGLLVTTNTDGTPVASHIPFQTSERGGELILEGHVARPNEQSKHIQQGLPALAVFQGPHTYVSPTWYRSPGVPTWNYEAVHAYGRLKEVAGEGARSIIERLAGKFEGEGPDAWVPDYPDKMLEGIVCFALMDLTFQSKSKMSQNRPEADRRGVMGALATNDDPGAREVRRIMEDNETRGSE